MGKNVVIFPGQGSQKIGMGSDVADASGAAADIFRRADDVLGFGLSKICFEGPAEELTRTDVQQPAIFCTSVAIWEAMRERGIPVDSLLGATAGLSLGEYTALYAAGSISFDDGLRLVRRRGELMQDAATATPSGMVSLIGGDESNAASLCEAAAGGEVLVPANFNCPGQIVISGAKSACERAVELSRAHGVRAVALDVAGAFHSPLMERAAEQLGAVLADVEIKAPKCPVIANVDASPHTDPGSIRNKLRLQVTHAVLWMASIENLREQGYSQFVEVGPGRVLTGMMRKIDRSAKAVNVSAAEHLDSEAMEAAVG